MGAIVGRLSFDLDDPAPGDIVARMAQGIAHRGPDVSGTYAAAGVALGWRAFASERAIAGQVGTSESGGIRAVADADLQNAADLRRQLERAGHRFRGRADAEILAHAYEEWGERCVEHLRGPFACAIWDASKRRLLLARDHIGVRPLYFALLHGSGVVFASEIKAVLADPAVGRQWNPEAVDAYLALGYVPAPLTAYKRVSKVEPAHVVVVEGRRLRTWRFWDLSFHAARERSVDDTVHAVEGRLRSAVRAQTGDGVGCGVLYSGGTASTALLAAAPHAERLKAVIVGVEHGATSELTRSAEAARRLGGDPDVELATPEVATVMRTLAWHFDEPFADPAAIAQYATCVAARLAMPVALTGHGAAALWAGYARHRIERIEALLRACFGSLAAVGGHLAHALPVSFRGARLLSHLALPPAGACAIKHEYGLFEDSWRHAVYTRGFSLQVRDSHPLARHVALYAECDAGDPLDRALYVDARTFLADDTLAIADRASLAASLRLRFPYLDRELLELAVSVPSSLKQHGAAGMYVLRRLLATRLPSALMPPAPPAPAQRPWLHESVRALVPDMLLHDRFDGRGIFSRPALLQLWDEHRAGRADHTQRFWALLMLECWFREFIDGDAAVNPTEYAVLRAA